MDYPLSTDYNFQLVVLSVAIAMLASYTALDLAGRVTATQGRAQVGWLVSGATAMGTGIWSMHFIGMLAFRLPLAVNYDFLTVLISILPAIFASGLALFLVSRPSLGWFQHIAGSLFMGLGIASMHYLGMAAMHTTAMMHYNFRVVALSVLIAIAVSFVGMLLVFRLREETTPHQVLKKLLAALHRYGSSLLYTHTQCNTRIITATRKRSASRDRCRYWHPHQYRNNLTDSSF
jgi:NO-binding membrane sensor protein with MHYT domain